MAGRGGRAGVIDASAVTLSGLCIIHCLALPIMSAALPILGVWAEAEWVHRVFVLVAVPISGFAILRSLNMHGGGAFAVQAFVGLSLLVAGAFAEALHDYEAWLTVSGGLILAVAHLRRWVRH